MKNFKSLWLLICISAISSFSYAQWEPTTGPLGGPAMAMYRVDNNMIVISNGSYVHRTTDLGQTWNQSGHMGASSPNHIEMILGKLWVTDGLGSFGYIFSSTDTGTTWTQSSVKPSTSSGYLHATTKCIYQFGNYMFWGGQPFSGSTEDLVFYSADSGQTWSPRTGGVLTANNIQVNAFASIGSTLFAATSAGIMATTDTGATWGLNCSICSFAIGNISNIKAVGTTLFAVNTNKLVYTSADTGKTWVAVNQHPSSTYRHVTTFYTYKGIVLGSSVNNDTLYSYNSTLNAWIPYSYDIKGDYSESFYGYGDTLYMGSQKGLYYSLNSGQTWTLSAGKIRGISLYEDVAVFGNSLVTIDQQIKNSRSINIYRSDDNGDSWNMMNSVSSGNIIYGVYSFRKTQNNLLYISYYGSTSGAKLSVDTGRTWTDVSSSLGYVYNVIYNNGKCFFLQNYNTIFSSLDSGKTVTNITNSIHSPLSDIYDMKLINGRLWIASTRYGLFNSSDNGNTWVSANSGLPSTYNTTYTTNDTVVSWITNMGNVLLCRARDAGTDKNYISYDNGQTWTLRSNAVMFQPSIYNNLMVYGGWVSTDTLLTSNYMLATVAAPYQNNINTFEVSDSYLFAVNSYQGVWRRSISEVQPPAAPISGVATGLNQYTLSVRWSRVEKASNYKLYYSDSATGPFDLLGTFYDTSYTISWLSANTTKYFYVTANNEFGASAQSALFSGTTMDKPSVPILTIAEGISTNEMKLTWQKTNATAYIYYIEIGSDSCCTFDWVASIDSSNTEYIVTNLSKNTKYWFRMYCEDNSGTSDYTSSFAGTTLDTIPDAPTSLDAMTVSNTSILLSWTDNASNETGFVIEQKESSASTFTVVTNVSANISAYTVTNLSAGTSYTFRVRAYNGGGYSAYSNTDTATTFGTTGIREDIQERGISLYPNPAQGSLQVEAGTVVQSMMVTDNVGKDQSVPVQAVSEHSYKLDVSALKSGIYFIKVQFKGGATGVYRFIKS